MNELELIHWKQEYSVGVDVIDTHHREMVELINALINNSEGSLAGKKKLFKKIMTSIRNLATKHFKTEEKILSKSKYGRFEEHKKEHENLAEKINLVKSEIAGIKEDNDLFNLTVNLKEWLLSHILLFDKEAHQYFEAGSKKVKLSG